MKPRGQLIPIGNAARRLGWTDYMVLKRALDGKLRVWRVGRRRFVRVADVDQLKRDA